MSLPFDFMAVICRETGQTTGIDGVENVWNREKKTRIASTRNCSENTSDLF